MKRERALQVVLVLVGLFYSFWGYLLFDALWHSSWLLLIWLTQHTPTDCD